MLWVLSAELLLVACYTHQSPLRYRRQRRLGDIRALPADESLYKTGKDKKVYVSARQILRGAGPFDTDTRIKVRRDNDNFFVIF